MGEKRNHTRYPVQARLKLFNPDFGSVGAVTENIADGGVYVRLDSPLNVREGSSIKMVMLDSKNPDIIFNTKLLRIEKGGCALEILSYEDAGQVQAIGDLRKVWNAR